jgi:pimeloyl-ACP methyl ester carboxylesterase
VPRSRRVTGVNPLKSIPTNGLNIAYQRSGEGPPLVLLHGFICDSRAWKHQINGLSRDFDVIAWDNPGCGGSSDTGEEFSMGEYADALAAFLDQIGVDKAHFCGLSWGGTLAMVFSRRYPDRVSSLILADSYAGWTGSLGAEAAEARLARCLRESELAPEEWVPQWAPEAFSPDVPQEMIDEYAGIMWGFHPVGFRAMSRALAGDFTEILPSIQVPTLLVWGEHDSRSPVHVGEAMRDAVPGSTLKVIPGAGHVSGFEQPDAFNAAVREFILGLDTEGS